MPRVKTVTAYSFDELSALAQDRIIDRFASCNVEDSYWYEWIVEDIESFGKASGLGCRFGGTFDCERNTHCSIKGIGATWSDLASHAEAVKAQYPDLYASTLAPFLGTFSAQETRNLARLERYNILRGMSGETSADRKRIQYDIEADYTDDLTPRITALLEKLEAAWEELLCNLEHTYVTMLRNEYDYQTSREAIVEFIKSQSLGFDEHGTVI